MISERATEAVRALAERLAAEYQQHARCRGVLHVGSGAEGRCDYFSDLDMSVYYDELPGEEELTASRVTLGGSERKWTLGTRADGWFAEAFEIDGIECQVGHTLISGFEETLDEVLVRHNPDTPLHKALDGLMKGRILFGAELIEGWQERARNYPADLGEALIRHNMNIFGIWYVYESVKERDAVVWTTHMLVEGAQKILGILAGLNHKYYTTFQMKRMGDFVAALAIKPERLAERIDRLFDLPRAQAVDELEALVGETVALVERERPGIDTSPARRRLGKRQSSWGQPV
ncbi:MAG TPA: hypothetical protein VLB27_00445 [candidate division Zixibacteria bacterium]|nr:hypothetical protein [candidate division Zixibacteria bacterium]